MEQNIDESELILKDVKERKEMQEKKTANTKKIARHMNSPRVMIKAIIASAVAGVMIGDYEVLVHGAEAVMPAFVGACGALGGAIASGIVAITTKQQAKIEQEKLDELTVQENGLSCN